MRTHPEKKKPSPVNGEGFERQFSCSVLVTTRTLAAVTTTVAATVTAAAAVSTAIAATATAAAVSTAITTTASAAETTTITFGTRTRLVHHQVTAVEILAIGSFNGSTTCIIVGHFHESEAAATVGGFVHDDLGRGHFTESFEKFAEILVLRAVRDVGDVNVHEFD
jgi:hypothetical protein